MKNIFIAFFVGKNGWSGVDAALHHAFNFGGFEAIQHPHLKEAAVALPLPLFSLDFLQVTPSFIRISLS